MDDGKAEPRATPGEDAAFLHRKPTMCLCVESHEGGECLSKMNATFNEVCKPTQKCQKDIVFPYLEKCRESCRVQA